MDQRTKDRKAKLQLSKEEKEFRELAKLPALSSKDWKVSQVSKEQLSSRDILTSQLARFQLDVNRAEKYKKERAHAELYASSTGDQKREFRETQSQLRRNGLDEKSLSDRRASLKEQISARSAFYERERSELASYRETLKEGSREANFYDAREAMLLKKSDKIDLYDLTQLRLSTHRYAEKLKTNERHQEVVKADARTLELKAKHSEVNTQGLFEKFKSLISQKNTIDVTKEINRIQKLAADEAAQFKKPAQAKPLDKTLEGFKKQVVDGKFQHVSHTDSTKHLTDHGKRIELSKSASQDVEILKVSLKLANEKFKNGFKLNGTDIEKKALVQAAIELGIQKQIRNPELKQVIVDAKRERFEERSLKARTNVMQYEAESQNKQSLYEVNKHKALTSREKYRSESPVEKTEEKKVQKEFRETLNEMQRVTYDRELESFRKELPNMSHIETERFNRHFESKMLKQSEVLVSESNELSVISGKLADVEIECAVETPNVQVENKVLSQSDEVQKDAFSFLEEINNDFKRVEEAINKKYQQEAESQSQGGRSQGR